MKNQNQVANINGKVLLIDLQIKTSFQYHEKCY